MVEEEEEEKYKIVFAPRDIGDYLQWKAILGRKYKNKWHFMFDVVFTLGLLGFLIWFFFFSTH